MSAFLKHHGAAGAGTADTSAGTGTSASGTSGTPATGRWRLDRDREPFYTHHPGGYLQRVVP